MTKLLTFPSGIPLDSYKFDAEDQLEKLLVENPGILTGDLILREGSKPWLVVTNQGGVPQEHGGSDHNATDILMVAGDGMPVIVEAKRARSPELRRTVIGQMAAYMAQGAKYWRAGAWRAKFDAFCKRNHLDPVARLGAVWAGTADAFWAEVDQHISKGNFKVVLVAEELPRETLDTVQNQNDRSDDEVEWIAIEVKVWRTGPRSASSELSGGDGPLYAAGIFRAGQQVIGSRAKPSGKRFRHTFSDCLNQMPEGKMRNIASEFVRHLEEAGYEFPHSTGEAPACDPHAPGRSQGVLGLTTAKGGQIYPKHSWSRNKLAIDGADRLAIENGWLACFKPEAARAAQGAWTSEKKLPMSLLKDEGAGKALADWVILFDGCIP